MRFSDRITFVKKESSVYDPDKGEYVDGETVEDVVPCKLSAMGVDRTNELFGKLGTRITIARLQRPYLDEFDHVLIDGNEYSLERNSDYRKGVLFLEGEF